MAAQNPPKNAVAYTLYVGLVDQTNTKLLKASPTIAAGDFKVSIDGGALANLATLPTVTPAAGRMVKISLSAGEMTGDNITIVCSDAAGAEWCDLIVNIQTTAAANALAAADFATDFFQRAADIILRRTYANARASAATGVDGVDKRSLLGAIGRLVNKNSIAAGTLTFTQEDDATATAPGGTAAVTVDGSGHITGIDPV